MGENIKPTTTPMLKNDSMMSIVSCIVYSLSSITMILTNKLLLTNFGWKYHGALFFFQNLCTFLMMGILKVGNFVQVRDFELPIVIKWIPVNILFCVMLLSNFLSTDLLSVHMMTVFKNVANILTTTGDWYFYSQVVNKEIVGSLVLLLMGAVLTGWTELNLSMYAMFWMTINCISTSSYVLYIKKIDGLNEFGKVYYNCVISFPFILPLMALWGEYPSFLTFLSEQSFSFYIVFIINGLCGFAISLSSFWCMKASSPTTFSLVGALNKIPLCFLGLVIFNTPITYLGFCYLLFSLVSGGLYAYAKIKLSNELKSKFNN
eukprot:TRINITY_DN8481_c0_g1_i1.p1 TRINITY_DN8481_c0_g1~~TRINITY_DN8481_c0_g1_i1.p1  ORF type:complete len:346 (-),score=60.62 TRINITY_DN8481_c0_g1_i1:7-963(-)